MTDTFFDALANPYRRQIIELLMWKAYNVGELTEKLDISQPSVSRHLSVLKQAGIVSSKRTGNQISYSLNLTVFQELLIALNDLLQKGCDSYESSDITIDA